MLKFLSSILLLSSTILSQEPEDSLALDLESIWDNVEWVEITEIGEEYIGEVVPLLRMHLCYFSKINNKKIAIDTAVRKNTPSIKIFLETFMSRYFLFISKKLILFFTSFDDIKKAKTTKLGNKNK